MTEKTRLPEYAKKKISFSAMSETQGILSNHNVSTVCVQARCPNISECFSAKTATFLIMGKNCTRKCRFCNVSKEAPAAIDASEPRRVAQAAAALKLEYVVITSVTRDDLPDYGASMFALSIEEVKKAVPEAKVEVLVPDFMADTHAIDAVLGTKPDVFGHNIETVPSLYHLRPAAGYKRSLSVLEHAAKKGAVCKSALLLGMGETDAEIKQSLRDLRQAGCSIASIGQYLQPSLGHAAVVKYYEPEEYEVYGEYARQLGFSAVESGVFVRSSFKAKETMHGMKKNT